MARKPKRYHFIYKTTNILTQKYYIGLHSSDSLNDTYLGSGRNLRYSINKYGAENHVRKILEFCNTRQELINRERDIINFDELSKKDCLNIAIGGGSFINKDGIPWNKGHKNQTKLSLTKEQRQKRSTDQNKIWIGRKHSDDTKYKMSESYTKHIPWNRGKTGVYSDEVLKKMSDSMSGKNHPNFGINHSGMSGKTHSKETKRKMSDSKTGRNNNMSGKSLMDVWIEKYGEDEANIRYVKWTANMKKARERRTL